MDKAPYGPTLLRCLLLSVGLCCAVFPFMPPDPKFGSLARVDLSFIITRCLLIAFTYYVQLRAVLLLVKRRKFHREQHVFWSLRCGHCANVLAKLSDGYFPRGEPVDGYRWKTTPPVQGGTGGSQNEDTESMPSLRIPENQLPVWARYENEIAPSCSHRSLLNLSSSLPDLSALKDEMGGTVGLSKRETGSIWPHMSKNRHGHPKLFTEPDRSLLVVFNILGVTALLNIPLRLVRVVKCFEVVEMSAMSSAAVITRLILHISFITLILCALIFFNTYHDATFLDGAIQTNLFGITFVFCFWIMAVKVVVPISESLNSSTDPCELPGSLEKFLYKHNEISSKIDAECGFIAAGIIWEMWKSVIPHRFMSADIDSPNFVPLFEHQASRLLAVRESIRAFFAPLKVCNRNVQQIDDTQDLYPSNRTIRYSSLPLVLMLFASFIFGVIIVTVSMVLPQNTAQPMLYVVWCLKIACANPLIGLIFYQSFLSKSCRNPPLDDGPNHKDMALQGHEVILLVSCSSSFLLSIIRIACAIAAISCAPLLSHDELILAYYTILYGFFCIFHLLVVARFLLVVQRQVLSGPVAKWTKICLVYIVLLNGMIWFIGVIGIHNSEGHDLRLYYGKTLAKFLTEMFDPLNYLFPLHAAIIAYETYTRIK